MEFRLSAGLTDMTTQPPRPLIPDFDSDPERFAANQAATRQFSAIGDVHQQVADRLAALDAGSVLDLGGGDGTLARLLVRHDVPTVVLDRAGYVRHAPLPAVQADAVQLPFLDGCFGAVAALWMLYYVPEPFIVLAEAARVLRASGVFVACTSSRYNDPEFAEVIPGWGEPFSFDAETAMDVVAEQFSITEILRWDKAVVWLPDVAAVRLFLRGRGLSETAAASEAARRRCPLSVTKRGCLIWARNEVRRNRS
jgi:SAM-dependent methyltransferase